MGAWYLSLAVSLLLILLGMVVHWSIMLMGLLLLFIPLISALLDRRRGRVDGDLRESDTDLSVPSADGHDEQAPGR